MPILADLKSFIIDREIDFSASVAQSTWRKIGGAINWILNRTHQEKNFYLNGNYGSVPAPFYAADGKAFFEYDAEIFNVWTYSDTPGVSGTTELDVKIKPKGSGTWTSIFSTTPKIAVAAGSDVWFEIGDTGTGITAPVLSSSPSVLNVNRGDAIRLDIISSMPQAENAGIVLHFRPR